MDTLIKLHEKVIKMNDQLYKKLNPYSDNNVYDYFIENKENMELNIHTDTALGEQFSYETIMTELLDESVIYIIKQMYNREDGTNVSHKRIAIKTKSEILPIYLIEKSENNSINFKELNGRALTDWSQYILLDDICMPTNLVNIAKFSKKSYFLDKTEALRYQAELLEKLVMDVKQEITENIIEEKNNNQIKISPVREKLYNQVKEKYNSVNYAQELIIDMICNNHLTTNRIKQIEEKYGHLMTDKSKDADERIMQGLMLLGLVSQ